jgi:deoxyribodipyrimidine photo-lyase
MASYFIHQLKLDWRLGARWFEMYLADADVASNYGNWAYIAGCGHDPRPQRQFNLNRQLRQYDPHAEHIHYWCPELSGENATNIIRHQTGEQILPLYPAPVVPAPDGD